MRVAYICSPLNDLEKTRRYARYVLSRGMAPLTPYLYSLILNYGRKEERKLGIESGLSLLWLCNEVWVFGDEITNEMREELKLAETLHIKIKRISKRTLKKIGGKNEYDKKD